MRVFSMPVVTAAPALRPNATLYVPVVLAANAPYPKAELLAAVLSFNAVCPTAVF